MKWLGLGLGLVVAACGAPSVEHVELAPLPPSPTPDQRVWIFNAVRPRGELTESTTTCDRHGGCFTTTNGAIVLPDGRTVRDPEDLAPLVAPQSGTLVHAHKASRAAGRLAWWGAGAITALVGGFLVSMNGHDNGNDTELEIGLGVAVGGLMLGAMAGYIERDTINDERRAAFASYPNDLAARLSLCPSGQLVMPCEQQVPGAGAPSDAPPATPDPGLDQLRPR